MDAGFYRAFEDRYRGERDDILQRLRAYEPFTLPYVQQNTEAAAPAVLDIGCGRGEWLELLRQQGFQVQGVDLDAGMLEACHERGLAAVQGDGIAYVTQQPADSLTLVSAFHVVEHIPFEAVIAMARAAHKALKAGGLIILETPNPENIVVASRDFYLDPSHQKPIPPQLLAFVLEYVGFERVKIVRLNENDYMREPEANLSLWNVLSGVSPDYAVVAQKGGSARYEQALEAAFALDYGVGVDTLALRYQDRAQYHLDQVLTQSKQMFAQQQELLEQTREDYHGYQAFVEERFMKIFSSWNWRLGAPIRFVQLQVRRVREKGLRACLRRLPYKLGWWRISQKLGKRKSAVMASAEQAEMAAKNRSAGIEVDLSSVHPKQWEQYSRHEASPSQSPLEQWHRERG